MLKQSWGQVPNSVDKWPETHEKPNGVLDRRCQKSRRRKETDLRGRKSSRSRQEAFLRRREPSRGRQKTVLQRSAHGVIGSAHGRDESAASEGEGETGRLGSDAGLIQSARDLLQSVLGPLQSAHELDDEHAALILVADVAARRQAVLVDIASGRGRQQTVRVATDAALVLSPEAGGRGQEGGVMKTEAALGRSTSG